MLLAPLDSLPEEGDGDPSASGGRASTGGTASTTAGDTAGSGTEPNAGQGGAPAPGPCKTNAECSDRNLDEKYRCRSDGECVPLATLECPLVYGDSNDDNAVFIGAFGAREGIDLADSTTVSTYRLAINEFEDADNLPGPGRDRRALVTVLCDNNPSFLDAAMRHLTEDVEVPGILATLGNDELLDAFRNYGNDRVFFLSSQGASRELVAEPDEGLIWSMLGQPSDFVPIYTAFLARLETYVLQTYPNIKNLRVFAVRSTDAFSAELADSVLPQLRFNEKNVATNFDDGNYRLRAIPVDDPTAAIQETVAEIFEFKPHIVLSVANEVFTATTGVVAQVEASWRATNPDQPRPFYVMSPANTDRLQELLGRVVERQNALSSTAHKRFLAIGAAPAKDRQLYDDFRLRLLANFPEARVEGENLYDAFYFMAFAIHAAGNLPELTGHGIATGMLRLLSPDVRKTAFVQPTTIADVFQVLTTPSNSVRLVGTMGPPDFNTSTGARIESGSITCFDENATVQSHVLRYNRVTESFEGELTPCYAGF
jgi:nucleoside-diphosphate-sugar epimerase